ncbi:MAG: hypothetical protein KAR13_16510 [Desulfobulbaceae bacterium]|nr:hypothetical protein [Desulfobulbaceae bacterium]MCK5436602.1 hypothetical protein [Desulfobulbaceae bacterium]MCK5545248.1 hypothetical protein [Desulfobulbaceae bacterium]
MARSARPFGPAEKTVDAIDRKRERERWMMIQAAYKNAAELATRLVQRLLDKKILETTSDRDLREVFAKMLMKLSDMEDFDIQYKIAPLRGLTNDPNFISLYITQYIVEDIIDHPKVQEIYGDDLEIYQAVDSIMSHIRPKL